MAKAKDTAIEIGNAALAVLLAISPKNIDISIITRTLK
jgi:hypothetical protein